MVRLAGDRHAAHDLEAHTPEFSAWKWVRPAKLPELIVPFKRPLYEAVREQVKEQAGERPWKREGTQHNQWVVLDYVNVVVHVFEHDDAAGRPVFAFAVEVPHVAPHLDHPHTAVRVEVDGDGRLHERLGGDEMDVVAGRDEERLQRLLGGAHEGGVRHGPDARRPGPLAAAAVHEGGHAPAGQDEPRTLQERHGRTHRQDDGRDESGSWDGPRSDATPPTPRIGIPVSPGGPYLLAYESMGGCPVLQIRPHSHTPTLPPDKLQ